MRLLKLVIIFLIVVLFNSSKLFAQNTTNSPQKSAHFSFSENNKAGDYLSNSIIVKMKPQFAGLCSSNAIANSLFIQLFTSVGGTGLTKKFPFAKAPQQLVNERGEHFADLTLIYEFQYSGIIPLEKTIDKFIALNLFEYVEPHYIPHTCYTPNDPSIGMQYAITQIQAPAAWGVNTTTARGDTNVVIGITDTGVEPTHNDLMNNIKHNYADPIGGGDTDFDGYTDNFSGWDLGENDNDPTYNALTHGVHVSGIACASTDNGIGIAGVGFNCKFLPVKIANASGNLTMAYEGITYAADHGCAIINCSWGGGGGGQMGQDVINYATINKNALVVAAAGNNGLNQDFYPASYQYVISVANTNSSDVAAGTTNYGYNIDVCAPGENIYSTVPTNTYVLSSGTSMASPCAAGAAAIIKSFYPSYNALQVGEQLKVTCDNIYPLNSVTYLNRLGYGRVNLFKALTISTSPSVVTTIMNETDNNDNAFNINDTIRFRGNYTNYLAAATNVTATLSSASPYISVLDGTTTLGAMATLGVANNTSDPFTVRILATAPVNVSITFKLTFADATTSYSHVEYITLIVNVDYVNIAINDVATTISSNGKIGYRADNQIGGLGFTYMGGGTLLYEAGLMVGVSGTQVSDVVRGTGTGSDVDFASLIRAHTVIPSVSSEFDVDGTFRDNVAPPPLPITVHHTAYAWTTVGNTKYVIVQYVINNTSTTLALNNLYAGIFADWDIDAGTFGSNRASFDSVNKMGYVYYTAASGLYAGIKLLTNSAPVVHYAIDNISGGGGGVDMFAGYDGTKKYTTLSTNRTDAGLVGTGNDVADVVSSGPFIIATGDSIKVAFALIAGNDLPDIQNSAVNAQITYDSMGITTSVNISQLEVNVLSVFPNPSQGSSTIEVNINEAQTIDLKVFNVLGELVHTIVSEKVSAGVHRYTFDTSNLSSGVYFYQLTTKTKKYSVKLMVSE